MDIAVGIQKAINYIEVNILNELDYNTVAKEVNISSYDFQRIFHILSGFSLGEYIRSRRLSLAASELQSNRIEELDGLRLLGKAEKQPVINVQAGKFWERCHRDGTLDKLTMVSTSPDKEHIGMSDGSTYDGENYLYYIVTPYAGENVPEGFEIKELPPRTWVKFRCVSFGVKDTSDSELWRRIYSEFFPSSDYEPAEYQLEVYPCGDGDYKSEVAEVWIAVRKRGCKHDGAGSHQV